MIGLLSPHTRAAVLASAPRRKIQKNRKQSDIRDDDGMYPFACCAFSQHVLSRVITCFHLCTRVDKYRPNAKEDKSARATKDDGGRPRPCETHAPPGVAASIMGKLGEKMDGPGTRR